MHAPMSEMDLAVRTHLHVTAGSLSVARHVSEAASRKMGKNSSFMPTKRLGETGSPGMDGPLKSQIGEPKQRVSIAFTEAPSQSVQGCEYS
mmetsp:Transcript_122230/g.356798  ORF Transcript_122230/g.356798 Transcript_122230/m.356798 type:complete len:91 (+) Transcript_122230:114-386(+)